MSIFSKFKRGTRPPLREQLRETEAANLRLQRDWAEDVETMKGLAEDLIKATERAELAESRLARVVGACGALATVENQDALREIVAIAEGRDDE